MLKSCHYCGRIHDDKYDCGRKPKYRKHGDRVDKFHSSNRWTRLAIDIKNRDHYLCQACLHNLDGKGIRYTTDGLGVHHIVSVENDWDRRFDYENLITLCREHHEMAEAGRLDREKLEEIAAVNSG